MLGIKKIVNKRNIIITGKRIWKNVPIRYIRYRRNTTTRLEVDPTLCQDAKITNL